MNILPHQYEYHFSRLIFPSVLNCHTPVWLPTMTPARLDYIVIAFVNHWIGSPAYFPDISLVIGHYYSSGCLLAYFSLSA